jgi:hypothetical protein
MRDFCLAQSVGPTVLGLEGPDASCWWVTEHVNRPDLARAASGSPQGTSTGGIYGAGGFDDQPWGLNFGKSTQTFTISPQDPRLFPNTPSFPVLVQLPSGPGGQLQDYGTLGHYSGGTKDFHFINGNSAGWVPCLNYLDADGYRH